MGRRLNMIGLKPSGKAERGKKSQIRKIQTTDKCIALLHCKASDTYQEKRVSLALWGYMEMKQGRID